MSWAGAQLNLCPGKPQPSYKTLESGQSEHWEVGAGQRSEPRLRESEPAALVLAAQAVWSLKERVSLQEALSVNNTTLHGLALARDEPSIATVSAYPLVCCWTEDSCVVASLCILLTVATVPP